MQALSHQSFIIRLNVRGQGPERLSLNLKLHWWESKKLNIYSCWWNFCLIRSIPDIVQTHLVCGTQAISVHQPGCMINPLLAVEGGIFIFLSRGHLMLHAQRQSAYEAGAGRLCRIISGQLAWQRHDSDWRLDRNPKIGAAKSSINEARDSSSGCTSERLLLCHLPAQAAWRGIKEGEQNAHIQWESGQGHE